MSAAFFHNAPPAKRQPAQPKMLLLAAGLMVVFAAITAGLLMGDFQSFDHVVFLAFRRPGDPASPLGPLWLQVAARDVTSLGGTAVLTLITTAALGFLGLKRQWRAGLFVLVSICGGTAVSFVLKDLIQRPRPDFVAAVAQTETYSFPSGHSFLSAVTFLTLGALLARFERQAESRRYILAVAVAITALVGISRVYIGVHWPTDVLAGWCGGAAWAILCLLIAERLQALTTPA